MGGAGLVGRATRRPTPFPQTRSPPLLPQPSVRGPLERSGSNRQSPVKRRHTPRESWKSQACRYSARDRLTVKLGGLPATRSSSYLGFSTGRISTRGSTARPNLLRNDGGNFVVCFGDWFCSQGQALRPSGPFRSSLWVQVKILRLPRVAQWSRIAC